MMKLMSEKNESNFNNKRFAIEAAFIITVIIIYS